VLQEIGEKQVAFELQKMVVHFERKACLTKPTSRNNKTVIPDVGHANFATVFNKFRHCHFDTGRDRIQHRHNHERSWPIDTFKFVILSHWDWDHLHGYPCCLAGFAENMVAPVQAPWTQEPFKSSQH
jgi:metal-dependent hydrolase (beta-lactamase superfamily II)